jgi:pyruvate dehydrogenase E2 component (dihydrolipoamide acetyltransferase)
MMVTNIGTLGVEEAFVPFVPYTNTHVICSVGKITEEAVYRDGEIRAGKVIKLCFTLDHRLVDGSTAAKVVKAFENYFENPELIK